MAVKQSYNLAIQAPTMTLQRKRQCADRSCFVHEGETCVRGERQYRTDCDQWHRPVESSDGTA